LDIRLPRYGQEQIKERFPALANWDNAYPRTTLPEQELAQRIRDFPQVFGKLGPELWQWLGETLTGALAESGVKPGAQIVILPQGAVGLLPIGIAQNPANGRRLMDDHPIAYAPNVAALLAAKARTAALSATPSITAIVNPTGDLRFTPVEAALVTSRFGEQQRTSIAQGAANPQTVLAALKGRDYWHFASHGFFDWNDARGSGLLLAEQQPLTVGALMAADGLKGPRLAVLSACESGLYDVSKAPDEFVGLPAALLQLGAGGVVSSLWPVDDLSTALLLARFYDLHRVEGRTPSAALREAQIWLRDATGDDLQAYAAQAVKDGRLPGALAGEMQGAMAQNVASRGLVSAVAALISSQMAGGTVKDGTSKSAVTMGAARPFANPYYWSGFILTGL